MEALSFQSPNIYILEKSVKFCGKTIAKSKKRVRWVIRHNHDVHEVNCSISFYSGKKRVDHNGFKIMDVVDSKEFIDFMVFVGAQRVMFMVDDRTEFVEVQPQPKQIEATFKEFTNVFSGPVRNIYEQTFG